MDKNVEKILFNALNDKSGTYTHKPLVSLHTIYLSGEITSPEDYTDIFETIRGCGQNDIIKIHINSPGGDLFTAIQFMRVLKETDGTVVCSVEGACMSAATLIFLAAEQFEISDHSVFMFHNYSTMMVGKGGELYDGILHDRKWSENLLKTEYEGFLTEEEIDGILNNKDIWLDADEAMTRLTPFIEAKKKRMEEEEAEEEKNSKKT